MSKGIGGLLFVTVVFIIGNWSCFDSDKVIETYLEFVYIPSGSFIMGSPANEFERNSNEGPQQVITVSSFKISKYEVTFFQYDAFCNATGRAKPSDNGWGRGNRPVINVSWADAVAFAQWLGPQYRLPTEAEWEYCCRAGSSTPFNLGYCLSSEDANYNGNLPYSGCEFGQNLERTLPVGSFGPNGFGLYDMHGNVMELCGDWFGAYLGIPQTNPKGPSTGLGRVLRGGGIASGARDCRSAYRSYYGTTDTSPRIGFRLVFQE